MTFKPCVWPETLWSICQGFLFMFILSYDYSIKIIGLLHSNLCAHYLSFSSNTFFKISMCLTCARTHTHTHTHTHTCRSSSTMDLIANDSTIVDYDFKCPINQAEDEGEEDYEIPEELARLLLQEEKVIQPHEESIEVINLGTETDKREVKIGANLEDSVKNRLVQMLHDYVEVFAWSYEDMPGLETDIVVHRLPIKEDCPPVKQMVRRMKPNMSEKIKAGVMKQFDTWSLAVTSYPQWVAMWCQYQRKTEKFACA